MDGLSNAQHQLLKLLIKLLRSGLQFRVVTAYDDQSARKMIHQVHAPSLLPSRLNNQQFNWDGEASLHVVFQHRDGHEGVSEEDPFTLATTTHAKQGNPGAVVEFLGEVSARIFANSEDRGPCLKDHQAVRDVLARGCTRSFLDRFDEGILISYAPHLIPHRNLLRATNFRIQLVNDRIKWLC